MQALLCPASSPCTRLSRALSTTSGSDFHSGFCLPQVGPFGCHTRPLHAVKTTVDLPGSWCFLFLSCHALRPRRGLRRTLPLSPAYCSLPSFRPCRPSVEYHEAQSLHLRYGPSIALPTLNPCRYLHEPKARFLVGRLVPLSRAGISPAGSAKLAWRTKEIDKFYQPALLEEFDAL